MLRMQGIEVDLELNVRTGGDKEIVTCKRRSLTKEKKRKRRKKGEKKESSVPILPAHDIVEQHLPTPHLKMAFEGGKKKKDR